MLKDPNMIKYHLDKASYESMTGRPGPVWIDIPANIQSAFINPLKLKSFIPSKKYSSNKLLDKKIKNIAKKIFQSKNPLLHFGQGARISKSENLIKRFIEKYKMPFYLTWNATDLISSSNKYYVGRPGAFAERGTNFIVQNCDLFISVGTRLPFMVTGYNSFDFARKAFKVTVDIDSNETNKKRYHNCNSKRKDIIFNEFDIDFSKPLVLVEGVFDAIVAGDNAIPILGSTLREDSKLFQAIAIHDTPVYVALDPDAEKKAQWIIRSMLKYDLEVKNITYHSK